MADFTPDFLRKLVYREDERRYTIECTCTRCGIVILCTMYTCVSQVELQHECPTVNGAAIRVGHA